VAKPWRIASVLGIAISIAVGAFVVVGNQRRAAHDSELEREARGSWAETAHCLLGDPADAQQARAEQLHRIALAVACDPAELARPAEQRWPARCAPRLRMLEQVWRALEPSGAPAALADVAEKLEQQRVPEAAGFAELWLGALERFGIPATPADPALPEPPRPSSHPALKSLEPLFELPPRVLRIKQPGTLWLAGEAELVTVTDRQPGFELERWTLRHALERHTHVVLDPGAPALIAVHAGSEHTALVSMDGATLVELEGRIWSAFAARDGSIVAHSGRELVRRDARGRVVRQSLPTALAPGWMRLAGSHLLVREPGGMLAARLLGPRGLGRRLELGATSVSSPSLELCKTQSHVFVLLREHNLRTPAQLVVLGQQSARLFELPAVHQRLSCTADRAVALGLEASQGLLRAVQTTCGADACSTERSAVHPGLALDPGSADEPLADAVWIGDRIAVAWRAEQAVRLKVATRETLEKTPAQVVAEDPPPGADADPVYRFRLESLGDSAVLLLDAAPGSFGFFVTPLGVLPISPD
jgi:hypothetical protein